MIIVLKKGADHQKVEELKESLMAQGLKLHLSDGVESSLIGLIGDTTHIQEDQLRALDVVDDVKRIREPYKKASRSMNPLDTVVDVCGHKIGGGHFQVIAGPCSIETKEQITEVAFDVKNSGANLLRGALSNRELPHTLSRDLEATVWNFFWRQKRRRGFRL